MISTQLIFVGRIYFYIYIKIDNLSLRGFTDSKLEVSSSVPLN